MSEGKQAIAYVEQAGKAANLDVESVIPKGSPADEIIHFAENAVLVVREETAKTQ